MKLYYNFDEVQNDVIANSPPIIYKYRNWSDDNHKRILTNREIWMAHPMSLNDPQDVRPPYNFVVSEIDYAKAKESIYRAGRYYNPHMNEDELLREVELRFQDFKRDPKNYLISNRKLLLQDPQRYDQLGVFSCCKNCENTSMWAHYGQNHSGFAVGFETYKLARALMCTFGHVEYNDNPIAYDIQGNHENSMHDELFRKSTVWRQEDEYRFVTAGIGKYRGRISIYPPDAIREIIFGINTSIEAQSEILELARTQFPSVQLFKLEPNTESYGLSKVPIASP